MLLTRKPDEPLSFFGLRFPLATGEPAISKCRYWPDPLLKIAYEKRLPNVLYIKLIFSGLLQKPLGTKD
jgi:hypothetical protein